MMTPDPLREHVHCLLFSYAKAHLTTDHVLYTVSVVKHLTPHILKTAPLVDPTALTLPPDPFDNLVKFYSIDHLHAYEERFKPNNEATLLLKQHLRGRGGIPKTESVVLQDNYPPHPLKDPMDPILTRHSIRESPFRKTTTLIGSLPVKYHAFAHDTGLRPVDAEDVEEASIPYERTLKVAWVMNTEEREEVRNLLKHVTDMRRPQPDHKNSVLHPFLHNDKPIPILPREPEFIPLFPRSRRYGHGQIDNAGKSLQELVKILPEVPLGSDDSEMSTSRANLEIVDGWEILKISSPASLATPTSSQEDSRIDQLFLEDTPLTEPMAGLPNEKMDEIQIPRSRRIGGTYGRNPHILHEKTLETFLPPLLERIPLGIASKDKLRSSSPLTESLLGHPSINESQNYELRSDDSWTVFNTDIKSFHLNEDPTDIIMKATIEDKNDMFMALPQLPPPNAHTLPSLFLPASLGDLVSTTESLVSHDYRPLEQTVKGLRALRLSLSWVTFTVVTPLPSHEELSDVSELFLQSILRADVDNLLGRALVGDSPTHGKQLNILDEDLDLPFKPEEVADMRPLIAISRKDRQGLPRQEPSPHTQPGVKQLATVAHESMNDLCSANGSPKRQRLDDHKLEPYYEPSVLHFEDLVDMRIFDAPVEMSRLGMEFSQDDDLSHEYGLNADTLVNVTELPAENTRVDLACLSGALEQSLPKDPSFIPAPIRAVTSESDMASHSQRLADFARLRAKTINEIIKPVVSEELPLSSSPIPQAILPDLTSAFADQSTVALPENGPDHNSPHRYMTSMDFIQRQAIVRALRSPECNVNLVERTSLGGVDVILDPQSSIILPSLFTLPAYGKRLADCISAQTWRFRNIFVLFEAYPEALGLKPPRSISDTSTTISAYTPPILKAVKKLRRDVTIAEACGKKRAECVVEYAFANDAKEAARFVRYFGGLREASDWTGGVLWGARDWLEWEISEHEEDLSKLNGMNRMSAMVLLCQASADEILGMSSEERMVSFGWLIGNDAIESLNEELAQRLEMVDQETEFSEVALSSSALSYEEN